MLQVRHLHLSPLFIVVATACQGNVAAGSLPPLLSSCCAAIFYIIYTLNVVYDAADTFQGTAASKTGRGRG